jgi:tRNA(fMet)-specific endonuclease VapC
VKKYLLDTNICIYYIKGRFQLNSKVSEVGESNCFISEITVAELKFGIENSNNPEKMRAVGEAFIRKVSVVPIYDSLDVYAREKAKLRRAGMLIDDFDVLIGATAIRHNMVMVTNNIDHFARLHNIVIEDWTKPSVG